MMLWSSFSNAITNSASPSDIFVPLSGEYSSQSHVGSCGCFDGGVLTSGITAAGNCCFSCPSADYKVDKKKKKKELETGERGPTGRVYIRAYPNSLCTYVHYNSCVALIDQHRPGSIQQ